MEPAAFAARASPLITDLVISVHRLVRHEFRESLVAAEEAAGVTVRGLIADMSDLLLADRMTVADVLVRNRYSPEGSIRATLDDLGSTGHLVTYGDHLIASDALRSALVAVEEARAQAAAVLWTNAESDHAGKPVPEILAAAAVGDGLLASQVKAPEWPDAPHRLFQRLSRMRYLRNDSHAAAWSRHGLAPAEMVVLTSLWRRGEAGEDRSALASLRNRGLVADGSLTERGRTLRERIEDDTNDLDGHAYAVLDPARRSAWLEMLETLPRFAP